MATSSMDPQQWARKQLEETDPDLLRALLQAALEDLVDSEVEAVCTTDQVFDVYLKDLSTGRVELMAASDTGQKENGASGIPALSPDGSTLLSLIGYAPQYRRL